MIADEAKEIHWLLHFFSRPLQEQWARLPEEMAPVWLRLGEIDCEVDEPVRLLSLVLTGLLNGCGRYFEAGYFEAGDPRSDEALRTLDELRVLLFWFMLESWRDAVFERPEDLKEPDEIYRIWRAVARVCQAALAQPAVQGFETDDLSFEYFVEKYSIQHSRPL